MKINKRRFFYAKSIQLSLKMLSLLHQFAKKILISHDTS